MVKSYGEMYPVIPSRPTRDLQSPCYTPQTFSSIETVFIYYAPLNTMPLTIFFNFLGCPVPSISSCTLQDNLIVDRSGGISLDTAN